MYSTAWQTEGWVCYLPSSPEPGTVHASACTLLLTLGSSTLTLLAFSNSVSRPDPGALTSDLSLASCLWPVAYFFAFPKLHLSWPVPFWGQLRRAYTIAYFSHACLCTKWPWNLPSQAQKVLAQHRRSTKYSLGEQLRSFFLLSLCLSLEVLSASLSPIFLWCTQKICTGGWDVTHRRERPGLLRT